MAHVQIPIDHGVIAEFCRERRIQELALFGSVLRSDFGPESDVDVLVTFMPDAAVDMMDWSRIQQELSDLLGRHVDLVSKRGLKAVIRDDVVESSHIVYAA